MSNHLASPTKRSLVFWSFQAVLLFAAGGWAYRTAHDRTPSVPVFPLRDQPLRIEPLYDEPAVISNRQLSQVIGRLVLRDRGAAQRINHVDHALRLWGIAPAAARKPAANASQTLSPHAATTARDAPAASAGSVSPGEPIVTAHVEPRAEALSGAAMRQLLLDHRVFRQRYSDQTAPLLIDQPGGRVSVRVQQGPASSSHYDHTAACLAEVGTPADFPVFTPRRQTTFATLIDSALDGFRLNQVEYEWTALLAALYLPPAKGWRTSEGQYVSFDHLARRILREPLSRGVCAANHRMHALVVLLRIDEEHSILEPDTRAATIAFLSDVTRRLVASQHADGYWDLGWYRGDGESQDTRTSGTALGDRILATGHPLEWWALAPREVLPPRATIVAAAQWLYRTIDALSDDEVDRYYTYLTHAGRALLLWRGADCWEAFRSRATSTKANWSDHDVPDA